MFPIFLKLDGRRCLVVGAGEVAEGKIRGLIEARAVQERSVPMIVRIVGTNAAEAARLLEEAQFETAGSLDEAAAKAVAASRAAGVGGAAGATA